MFNVFKLVIDKFSSVKHPFQNKVDIARDTVLIFWLNKIFSYEFSVKTVINSSQGAYFTVEKSIYCLNANIIIGNIDSTKLI